MLQQTTMTIPTRQLEESPVALRVVDKDGEEYKRLRDAVGKVGGVLVSINVTPAFMGDGKTPKTTDDGLPIYRIVDGLHRYTACKELGIDKIPAIVMNATELEIAKRQFIANAARVKTKPYEFANHLNRIMNTDDTMTLTALAAEVAQSAAWIGKLLGLVGLHKEVGKLVDEGKISVSNAADLAKLKPLDLQLDYVTDAMGDRPEVFGPKVKAKIKELRDAKRAARDPNEVSGFQPTSHFRKKPEVDAELAAGLPNLTALIKAKGITDPITAAKFTVEYLLHLDEQSVTAARAKYEAREQERKAESAKRAADRAEQRAKETREEAAKVEAAVKAGAVS